MLFNLEIAKEIADNLLQINAIQLNLHKPFTWASGWKSPIYCDNRKILSYPAIRDKVKDSFAELYNDKFGQANVIAGVATAGIPHGALLANKLNLPFCYVRPSAKDHGLQNKIEGELFPDSKVLVIEDLVSTGKSSLQAVEALKDAGAEIVGLAAIFTYGFPHAYTQFEATKCEWYCLSDYETLISLGVSKHLVSQTEVEKLRSWRVAPDKWGS